MRYPTLFVNHGGGPLPLLGRQPELVQHMKETVTKWLPSTKPSAVVVLSAHWESNPVKITSSPNPDLYFDYYGFPPESYDYKYPAPGNPALAEKIHKLLGKQGIRSELDPKRGLDHGVFIPLMIMYPEADIPVVAVSMDSSLSSEKNMAIGKALEPLRDEGVLILGSGFTFHNMQAFFHPSSHTLKQSRRFNHWLQETLGSSSRASMSDVLPKLAAWEEAPGARVCHPREEHLLPLFMTAAAAGPDAKATLVWSKTDKHAISSFMFE